jgi:tetratricopeptide (TPR) repeat protein
MSRIGRWCAGRSRVTRLAAVVALGTAFGLVVVGGFSAARNEWRFRSALEAEGRGEFAAARDQLARCLRDEPDSGRLLFHAARTARRDGDYPVAAKLLARAKAHGWPAEAVEWEATLLKAQTGEFAACEARLRTAVAAAPDHPDADLMLEVLVPGLIGQFRLADAYAYLADWIERRPNALAPRLWMFDVARKMLIPQEAIESARQAAVIAPDNADARRKCAEILIENHQAAEARGHFEWLLERRPADAAARFGLARCLKESGDDAGAVRELNTLLSAHPDHGQYLAELGLLEMHAGRPSAALDKLRKAVDADPSNTDLLYNYALALEQCDQPAEAARWREKHKQAEADLLELKEVTKRFAGEPRNAELPFRAGELMMRNGHEWEALRWFRRALQIEPQHPASRQAVEAYYRTVRAGAER